MHILRIFIKNYSNGKQKIEFTNFNRFLGERKEKSFYCRLCTKGLWLWYQKYFLNISESLLKELAKNKFRKNLNIKKINFSKLIVIYPLKISYPCSYQSQVAYSTRNEKELLKVNYFNTENERIEEILA